MGKFAVSAQCVDTEVESLRNIEQMTLRDTLDVDAITHAFERLMSTSRACIEYLYQVCNREECFYTENTLIKLGLETGMYLDPLNVNKVRNMFPKYKAMYADIDSNCSVAVQAQKRRSLLTVTGNCVDDSAQQLELIRNEVNASTQ